jgi:hypothetical protein
METKELWVLIYDNPLEIAAGGKIVASFGNIIIFDSIDFALEHKTGVLKCSGKCYAQDLSGYPNEDTAPEFFLTQEDLAKEIQRLRVFWNVKKKR